MLINHMLSVATKGRGLYSLTTIIEEKIQNLHEYFGLCYLFIKHTSASLIISENADPDVLIDLEYFMSNLVQDGNQMFKHQQEGPDDMPAHIRSVLTSNSITVPFNKGRLSLGMWQDIYLWEHRIQSHSRKIILTVQQQKLAG